MARVTVEDCLKRIPNRFLLVHTAAKRVRQLREGTDRLIKAPSNGDIVAALREIAAGKVFVTEHAEETFIPDDVEVNAGAGTEPENPVASGPEEDTPEPDPETD
ncbi:MAG: DNA-directed RNA polymerase subunit omega [Desulfosalsimonas sp.]|uniref:DNA-directed RNA polymerase subunit omega n=1 Tax=Desulfosalsimonas sp. TaxID=3073848 RepID=UPI003970F6CD